MSVQPVVVPIDGFGRPTQPLAIFISYPLEQRSYVVGPKDVAVVDNEGTKGVIVILALLGEAFESLHGVSYLLRQAAERPQP